VNENFLLHKFRNTSLDNNEALLKFCKSFVNIKKKKKKKVIIGDWQKYVDFLGILLLEVRGR
jgi:hypothetical protein